MEKSKRNIILIEENYQQINFIKEALKDYDIRLVFSPYKLIAALCAEKPDLIIMNSTLIWFHSESFVEAVNGNPYLATIPIIVMQGEGTSLNNQNICKFNNCHLVNESSLKAEELSELVHSTIINIEKEQVNL